MIFKQHKLIWMLYIIITILSLVVALSISATINIWGLTYSILLIFPFFGFAWLIKFFYQNKLNLMINKFVNKRKIKYVSIGFSLLSTFLMIAPLVIGTIVSLLINEECFNPYMLLAYFIIMFIAYYLGSYIEMKKNKQDVELSEE